MITPERSIVILRGLPGVGKSTIAGILRERLSPCVRLSIDTLRYLMQPRTLDHHHLRAVKIGAFFMAAQLRGAGFSSVMESTFEEVEVLDEIVARCREAGLRPLVVTLQATMQDLLARNRDREPFLQTSSERIEELAASYDQDVGRGIDTSGLIPEEIVEEILRLLACVESSASDRGEGPRQGGSKQCLFIRHGEFLRWEAQYPTFEGGGLTREGRAQVRRVAALVRSFDPELVVVSPMRRCQESAALIGLSVQAPLRIDDRLRERHFGQLAGLSFSQIRDSYGADFLRRLCEESELLTLDGEEQIDQAQQRVAEGVSSALEAVERRVVLVSHGGPHSWLCCHLLGAPLSSLRSFALDEGKFSLFEFAAGGVFARVCALNHAAP